jgi:hypothetical protein
LSFGSQTAVLFGDHVIELKRQFSNCFGKMAVLATESGAAAHCFS